MELGEFIKKRRRELNLTQEQLAEQIGKKKDFICAIETGKVKSIKSENVLPLAKILKCPTSVLLYDEKGRTLSVAEEIERRRKLTDEERTEEIKKHLDNKELRNKLSQEELRKIDEETIVEWEDKYDYTTEINIDKLLTSAKKNGQEISPEQFADIVELLLEMAPDMDEVDQRAIKRDMDYLRKE